MFRTPPPEIAMCLAEERRRNLMESAPGRSQGGTLDRNPRSLHCVVIANLGRFVHCLEAALAKFQSASEADGFDVPSLSERAGRS